MTLTLPNILTIFRVVAAPLLAMIYLVMARPGADIAAFVLFTVAAISDFFDGWLARKWGQVSAFGRMLDPIADKAMIAIAAAVIAAIHGLDPLIVIPVTFILLRETLVSGLREYLKGAEILSVTLLAKWKTTAQMFAFGSLFLAGATDAASLLWLGIALLWVAAALTIITGWDYFTKGLVHIAKEDLT